VIAVHPAENALHIPPANTAGCSSLSWLYVGAKLHACSPGWLVLQLLQQPHPHAHAQHQHLHAAAAAAAAGAASMCGSVNLQRYVCWMHTTPAVLYLVKSVSNSITTQQVGPQQPAGSKASAGQQAHWQQQQQCCKCCMRRPLELSSAAAATL
jgi:hypothetical protein